MSTWTEADAGAFGDGHVSIAQTFDEYERLQASWPHGYPAMPARKPRKPSTGHTIACRGSSANIDHWPWPAYRLAPRQHSIHRGTIQRGVCGGCGHEVRLVPRGRLLHWRHA